MNIRLIWNLIGFVLASIASYASASQTELGWSIVTLITGITAVVFMYRATMSLSTVKTHFTHRS